MSKLVINERIQIPFDEFQWSAVRSQGPGGQNVNKVNSKVLLQWNLEHSPSLPDFVRERFKRLFANSINKLGYVTVASQTSREQERNRKACLDKLRVMILDACKIPKPRKPTKPTRASRQRRHRAKQLVAQKKQRRQPPKHDND